MHNHTQALWTIHVLVSGSAHFSMNGSSIATVPDRLPFDGCIDGHDLQSWGSGLGPVNSYWIGATVVTLV